LNYKIDDINSFLGLLESKMNQNNDSNKKNNNNDIKKSNDNKMKDDSFEKERKNSLSSNSILNNS